MSVTLFNINVRFINDIVFPKKIKKQYEGRPRPIVQHPPDNPQAPIIRERIPMHHYRA